MCTVTYLPDPGSGFILTHNRDEHFTRGVAFPPEKKLLGHEEVLFPVDSTAGGTWIATGRNFTLCLLNGGFVRHARKLPYRHSRGHVIIDFFRFRHVGKFISEYDLENIEPFTLIIMDHQSEMLNELVFDGKVICRNIADHVLPHIWSSTTLYTEEQRETRRNYFQRFLNSRNYTQQDIINFHKNKFETYSDEGIQINREDVLRTVSLTSISKSEIITMHYEDFIYPQTIEIAL